MLVDRFGRSITYLRVSVTDRCNFRCVYCMPTEGIKWKPHDAMLSYEEIAAVVRVAAEQGVRNVRLTGGEPLVRLDLPDLVRMIAEVPGIEDISLTTNGMLLERMAGSLKDAGLKRVNVSLDTLDPQKFARITRGGALETLWRGLEAAKKHGLSPIKINVVAMRGINDDEITDMAKLSIRNAWDVRFIELMPVENQKPWGDGFPNPEEAFLSIPEIKKTLAPLGLAPVPGNASDGPAVSHSPGVGPAQEFRLTGGLGGLGFISPLTNHFCESCNRLRVTADGNFRPCLLQDVEVPFLSALRAGEPVLPYLQKAIELKPLGHELNLDRLPVGRCMQQIGG